MHGSVIQYYIQPSRIDWLDLSVCSRVVILCVCFVFEAVTPPPPSLVVHLPDWMWIVFSPSSSSSLAIAVGVNS